jgi:hypothetical protein
MSNGQLAIISKKIRKNIFQVVSILQCYTWRSNYLRTDYHPSTGSGRTVEGVTGHGEPVEPSVLSCFINDSDPQLFIALCIIANCSFCIDYF